MTEHTEKRTYIVVTTYNRKETAVRLLEHLQGMGVFSWANVLVADSNSSDGTPDEIERRFPQVTVLRSDRNLWWAGLICKGTRCAVENGAERVVWLNEDCRPRQGALEELVAVAQREGAVCGGLSYEDGTDRVLHGGRKKTHVGMEPVTKVDAPFAPCDALDGTFMCVPKNVLNTIGLPDVRHMPHYMGDIDFTLRARRAGFPVLLVRDAVADCDKNPSEQYMDYLRDPRVDMREVWKSLLSPRSRSYLPAQFIFKTRHWGLGGFLRFLFFIPKLACITLARPLTARG